MKASIKTYNFISFLKLFGEEGKIDGLEIGDTRYKKEGWIEKSILKGNHTIEGILELNYDFNGLGCFVGNIGNYKILFKTRHGMIAEFEVKSSQNSLRTLEYQIVEKNAYKPGLFVFSYIHEYIN